MTDHDLRDVAEKLRLEGIANLLDVIDRFEKALEEIASCESHAPGDVVDIARAAIGVPARVGESEHG